MARALRIAHPGATYHFTARGNQGRSIFADDRDRKRWLETLDEGGEKTGWHVPACVLMGNHHPLLVGTPEVNLVAGMQWLQGTHTQCYNGRHSMFGHLCQGRDKALLGEGGAGRVRSPFAEAWSDSGNPGDRVPSRCLQHAADRNRPR